MRPYWPRRPADERSKARREGPSLLNSCESSSYPTTPRRCGAQRRRPAMRKPRKRSAIMRRCSQSTARASRGCGQSAIRPEARIAGFASSGGRLRSGARKKSHPPRPFYQRRAPASSPSRPRSGPGSKASSSSLNTSARCSEMSGLSSAAIRIARGRSTTCSSARRG